MQEFLFKDVILPVYFDIKGLDRLKYYKELKKRDFLTTDELKDIQWKKLKLLLNHCYQNIPYYRKIFLNLDIHPDDIKNLKDYSQIPLLKKTDIRDFSEELIDPNIDKKKLCYSATGGSTGIPLKVYKSIDDQEYGFALRYRSSAWSGWDIWKKTAWLVSDLKRIKELDSMKKCAGLWLKRKLMLNTKNCTKDNMFNWVTKIQKYKPMHVYGYSTLLLEFSKFILENNINIDGINGVCSTAEPLRDRDLISKAFNTRVFDQYGASEIPCIAHECTKGNMHINIDEVLVEFVDTEEDSNIKKIICTPLYIYGMPLLRYDLGDTALLSEKKCDCGLPYPVMELNISRISDNLLSESGRLVATSNIGWHLAHMTTGLKQFQFIQETTNAITAKLVSDESVKPENERNIKELLSELLGTQNLTVNFEYVEEIKLSNSGKLRPVISKVAEKF